MVNVNEIKRVLESDFHIYGDYHIDPLTGMVDVEGDVKVWNLPERKLTVQFGHVKGDFTFRRQVLVDSLAGSPHTVGGTFDCAKCQLHTLAHAPKHVYSFNCSYNPISSLTGAPEHVTMDFVCSDNIYLTELIGAPRMCANFYVDGCFHVSSLKGAPDHVINSFDVSNTQIKDFEHAPAHVGQLHVRSCAQLTSLEHMPQIDQIVWITYNTQLPLLRLLTAPKVLIYPGATVSSAHAADQVQEIINKYTGQGKKGALTCAAELIKSGYKHNARW